MDSFQEEIHLKDYLRVIRRHKGTAFLFFIAVVGVVTAGSFFITPIYRATATIFIDLESPNMLTATDSVALGSQNYYAYKEYYQSQQEILKSRTIARTVFDEFRLMEKPKYQDAKEPLDDFLKTVKIEPVRDTRLVKLHVENEDPILAAAIANRIAELYVRQNLEYISKGEYLNLLKNEYLKLQSRLSEYAKVYKEKHPKMLQLKQLISQMAATIEAEKQKTTVDVHSKMSAYSSEVSSISRQAISGAGSENREAETLVSDPAVVAGVDALGNVALDGLKANNVRIMDKAEVPTVPARPKKRLNIALAIFVGLFGGIGLTFFAEYLDTTIHNETDVEHYLEVEIPFLGNIPHIESERGGKKFSEEDKDLICHLSPTSIVTESYRMIRTNILSLPASEKPARSIVVTSPAPEEGKTITACNLAITFANLGYKVLLIDGDLRKPRLHEVFGVENKPSLSDIIMENLDAAKATKATHIEKLFLIPAGTHSSNPAEILGATRLKEVIGALRTEFDFIFIDTPPVNVVTDAAILAGFVDGAIIVVEGGRTVKEILSRTKLLLKNVRARILGVVVNNVTQADQPPYYYPRHYYAKSRK